MDRNTIIGFALLCVLGAGYIFWSNHEQKVYLEQKRADSLAMAATQKPLAPQDQVSIPDSLNLPAVDSSLPAAFRGQEQTVVLQNADLKVSFTNKGAYPVAAGLDSFKTYDGEPLNIFSGKENRLSIQLPVAGKHVYSDELYFTPELTQLADGAQQLRFTAQLAQGQTMVVDYVLPAKGYMMAAHMKLLGMQQELGRSQQIPLQWSTEMLHTEKDLGNERLNMQMHYLMADGEHDYFTVSRTGQKSLDQPVKWMSVRSHFFNATIIADEQPFKTASYDAKEPADSNIVATNTSNFNLPVVAGSDFSFRFKWYMGPNDYTILKSYKMDMEEMIQLGYGPFFFVKYISKWMIIPIFDVLSSFMGSMGLIIICLTLIIRLLLSFFSYKSYLSSAKMRVLKPELEQLRAKLGDNQQQMGMEQMKLYRTAGVNPLGGCLPMLLQMPFLLAVYYFIPTAIQLRQSRFLWAEDLSTYDSILDLGFKIPLYGDHVSLFTLLMTASSLFLALYNKNMTAGAAGGNEMNNAMMKYLPYIMPFMFLGWFNGMAAGLTFYYTFSNLVSIAQQFIIQKFVIDEDKIHRKIQENRNKPAATSKWQQRLEEMQKAQAQKMKQKK